MPGKAMERYGNPRRGTEPCLPNRNFCSVGLYFEGGQVPWAQGQRNRGRETDFSCGEGRAATGLGRHYRGRRGPTVVGNRSKRHAGA
jgi:hypothetical protein